MADINSEVQKSAIWNRRADYMVPCVRCGHRVMVSARWKRRMATRTCRCGTQLRIRPIDSAERQKMRDHELRAEVFVRRLVPANGETQAPPSEVTLPEVQRIYQKTVDLTGRTDAALEQIEVLADQVKTVTDKPDTIVVQAPVALSTPKKISGRDRHQSYDELMVKLAAGKRALLVGPAGCGKSTLARQVAEDLSLSFGYLPCTEGLSEAHLLGRMTADGSYISSDFVRVWEKGGVFLFDEVDAMDPNTALVVNEALSNGHLSLPNRPRKPLAKKHESTLIVAAANTYGTGTDLEYAGRNQLDAAFLDRFVGLTLDVDYDQDLERSVAKAFGIENLASALWRMRENVRAAKIRRTVSTRAFAHLGALHKTDSKRYPATVEALLLGELTRGWTDAEIAKALDGVKDDDASKASPAGRVMCPSCEHPMVKRMAQTGMNRGKWFWGCSRYPTCNAIRQIDARSTSSNWREGDA